jgi:hypothetical protein
MRRVFRLSKLANHRDFTDTRRDSVPKKQVRHQA